MTSLALRATAAWLGTQRITPDVQVDCSGGLIEAVGRTHPVAADVQVVQATGFLMPATADRHVHIGLSDPTAVLRGGVTAVRDLGWPTDAIFELAGLSEGGSFSGPLIRACGPMLTAVGGYPTRASWAPVGTGMEVEGVEDALEAVDGLVARGAAAIKVSLNAESGPVLSDAQLEAICARAHEADLTVTAHAQGAGQVERGLGAGLDELAHAPWTRLSDDVVEAAAARLRIVSTLDTLSFGRDMAELGVRWTTFAVSIPPAERWSTGQISATDRYLQGSTRGSWSCWRRRDCRTSRSWPRWCARHLR